MRAMECMRGPVVVMVCLTAVLGCSIEGLDTVDPAAGFTEPEVSAPGDSSKAVTETRRNRLAGESSPYLLLHAGNPVDWHPWGPEAFDKAKREDKLIFLSIGYSSCYWCHVMEREVFSNEKIAQLMNDNLVSIKVDREERPDVDDIYMTALSVYYQAVGDPRGGGWPLSMFLTPEGKPIAGGTYFPPEDGAGQIGFGSLVQKISASWRNEGERPNMKASAAAIADSVQRVMRPRVALTAVPVDRALVSGSVQSIIDAYDPEFGGVDFDPRRPHAPKFPSPSRLRLLQYEIRRHNNPEAEQALYGTLDRMAAGGIYDHLGGGFHRYSTDRAWLVPHFEKMLYDQSQLADVYVEAYRQTGKAMYREVAEGIFRYVNDVMTDAGGGFYSALDAETDHVEGKYYIWTRPEVEARLSGEAARLFMQAFGMDGEPEFEHGWVLHRPQTVEALAAAWNTTPDGLALRLEGLRKQMLDVRRERERPLLDDKILASWNGLMIRALARAGDVFDSPQYLESAAKGATFVTNRLRDGEGRLLRSYRADKAALNAYLDDYAFLADGLLTLYDATGDEQWLNAARDLVDDQNRLFWDEKRGGYFFTSNDHEALLARTKNAYDSVLPSGNSVSARNLSRLALATGDDSYRVRGLEVLRLFANELRESPGALPGMAVAVGDYLDRFGEPSENVTSPGAEHANAGAAEHGSLVALLTQGEQQKPPKVEHIKAKAYLNVDRLPAGRTCRTLLNVEIDKGWHINTNPAAPDFLVATEVTLKSKHGTQMANVKYPAGTKLRIPGFDEPLHVYEQRALIGAVLNVPAKAGGMDEELEIIVQYQACDDQRCLAPTTLSLKFRVPVAPAGEPVKSVNQQLFDAKDDQRN